MQGISIKTKWVATVASIWIQCSSGSLYTFAIFSSLLKSSQSYDQSTLDTIAVVKDLGANFGLLSGLLCSSFSSLGPSLALAAGAVQSFAGYFLMWLAVTGVLPRPPLPVMCLFMLLAAHAQTFFNTADVVVAVNNFPDYSGTAVGIMKGFVGLSGAILIQVYKTVFKNKPASYLLMLALLPTINPLLLMFFVRIYNTKEGDEKKHLNAFSLVALIIAAYLMVIIILENILCFPVSAWVFTTAVLIIFLGSPLYIAIQAQKMASYGISQTLISEGDQTMEDPGQLDALKMYSKEAPVVYRWVPGETDQDTQTNAKKTLQSGENLNLLQAMCTLNFWFLFLAMACGSGSGLATVNNISQIGGSLGYTTSETSTLVSLWSIWNFLGRFGAGFVSDYFLHTKGWARPLFMVITLASMSIGHAVIASGLPGALYVGSVLVGVCHGSQWSLMPTITSEIFGIQHMGTIFNTITMASPVGSYILSVRVIGYIYDREALTEGNTCTGIHCFLLSFLIMALATLLGSIAALGLFFRTRSFYNSVVLRRLRHTVGE
ncbi:protein NUCLEAR FUSION DEFECTIVE 4-like [Malania oleifera]|uniref:protein NUCLEAR FUSION DEFECTIVE 4-like n=1 Tax=Malania oleifera TaxID=397392 RepID=UPI0025ADF554|nr:protein NUCLEAR FUSION DEFECTIVE 4-like [Malania oleifera]